MAISKSAAAPLHPYYPPETEIFGYLANEYSVAKLLTLFGAGVAGIFAVALVVMGRAGPRLGAGERMVVLWFVLCGFCFSISFSLGGLAVRREGSAER
jgi:cholestenol delta-isomerase